MYKRQAAACAGFESDVASVGDADFEAVVLNKAHDVFVLFYKPSAPFCAANGTSYAAYAAPQPTIKRLRMDVSKDKSPFVFEDSELPVLMLFPASDKRPLEFNEAFEQGKIGAFAEEHCSTLAKAHRKAFVRHAAYLLADVVALFVHRPPSPLHRAELLPGVHALLAMCTTVELRECHAASDGAGKRALKALLETHEATRFKGKI